MFEPSREPCPFAEGNGQAFVEFGGEVGRYESNTRVSLWSGSWVPELELGETLGGEMNEMG